MDKKEIITLVIKKELMHLDNLDVDTLAKNIAFLVMNELEILEEIEKEESDGKDAMRGL